MKKILAVASGGGHWTQMMRLREVFDGHDVAFVGVKEMYRSDIQPHRFHVVPDTSRLHKSSFVTTVFKVMVVVFKERPDVVMTTGSLPGLISLFFGKLLGARTIWIDSIANVEEMSLSGKTAKKFADICLTQWPHLATQDGPSYFGSVL